MLEITEILQLEKEKFKRDMAIVAKRVSCIQVLKLV